MYLDSSRHTAESSFKHPKPIEIFFLLRTSKEDYEEEKTRRRVSTIVTNPSNLKKKSQAEIK